ncbi:hypothetical protein BI032_gp174 [Citrobacter phage vB_CfrM_CfP1]|uniref:Uncharacterized protein n=1 Tax=Citrobacter phage vB_CfrM_CfP1 TaxID=1871313 RepID=A0A1B1IXN5_9CAUD|nr:hypothetical protein BI032_gp174 [Citrobacter phage vB_CfrM_CfP1]ANS06083.1 hypothetical protein ABCD_0175 [Citrobacter phage vB_CfrM_CfP1]
MNGKRVVVIGESKHNEKGQHLIINNDRGDWYGATNVNNGYATIVEKDAVRIATPADPGYYGTRDEFESEKDQEIAEMKTQVHNARVYAAMCFTVAVVVTGLIWMVVYHG